MIGAAWVLREGVCECQANCAVNVRWIVPDCLRREAPRGGPFGQYCAFIAAKIGRRGPCCRLTRALY
jgi:hypothetical protein